MKQVRVQPDEEEVCHEDDDQHKVEKKCCSSWNPFECSVSEDTWVLCVDPEKLRVIFYFEFWAFMALGMILTVSFSELDLNHFDYHHNPITAMFGNPNPCVFFDDPPFSYFGAALWFVLLGTMWLYLFVDLKRVYTHKRDREAAGHSVWFYRIYTAVSIFIALSFAYFVEVFAIQPSQDVVVHWVPFTFLMWSLFLLCVQHFTYMITTKQGLKPSQKWPGIAYVALVFTTVFIKFTLDLINATGAQLWRQPGLGWTKYLAVVNDQIFMVWVMGFPILIYRCFVDSTRLDKVKFTIATVKNTDARYDGNQQ